MSETEVPSIDADGTQSPPEGAARWRHVAHRIIFGHRTRAGQAFDVVLLIVILASVAAVMLETVESVALTYGPWLLMAEWVFTLLFTAEYALRLACVRGPARYARSFFGVVDLLAILPTYATLLLPGTTVQSLVVIRALRLLRVFRILKLTHLMREGGDLRDAIWHARGKVLVFLLTILVIVSIVGSLMFLIEGGDKNGGFTSIPQSVYWAIITMTTVGYGDVVPHTAVGKMLSAVLIILGYSLIIVPTGFVSASFGKSARLGNRTCPRCGKTSHASDANFCDRCGENLKAVGERH